MRITKYIFIALTSALTIFFIGGFLLPSQYTVERSIIINTPADYIFEEVNNLGNWQYWSPWQEHDPELTLTYEGPDAGVGCKMRWSSENPKVGCGCQEIVNSQPSKFISTRLDFQEWNQQSVANWYFEEQGNGSTQVRWSHHSNAGKNALNKYISHFFIKPTLGKDYESGLKQLKVHTERSYAFRQ